MPTTCKKTRRLLKQGKAKIAGYRPFTIQLNYATGENKQTVTLGIDAGYKNIGISVVSPEKELLSCEIQLLEGQVERNKKRAMYRRQRRNRLRYRKSQYDNQTKSKGWLAPSIQHSDH